MGVRPLLFASLIVFGLSFDSAFAAPQSRSEREIAENARAFTLNIRLQNGAGSAFVVHVGKGGRLVTARHAINRGSGCDPRQMEKLRISDREGGSTQVLDFHRDGSCQVDMDYASVPMDTGGTGLKVIKSGEAVVMGERVVVVGYHNSSGRMTHYFCTLAGFMGPFGATSRVYYHVDCPDAENNNMGGMSGGPVISLRLNKVIGLLSVQEVAMGNGYQKIERDLAYTPIFENVAGELRTGFTAQYKGVQCRFPESNFTCDVSASGSYRRRR